MSIAGIAVASSAHHDAYGVTGQSAASGSVEYSAANWRSLDEGVISGLGGE